jgi:hypothetical protein
MPPLCRRQAVTLLAFLTGAMTLVAACERNASVARKDSSNVQPPLIPDEGSSVQSSAPWIPDIGPAFLVEGSSPSEAIIVSQLEGDTLVTALGATAGASATVALFGRGGQQLTAQLGDAPSRDDDACTAWPLRDVRGEGGNTSWSLGFLSSEVRPVALDSIDLLSARDSMTLVAEVSRLASAVTAPTDPSFQGLRFTVHDIRRFEARPGVAALVAHVIRRVNQEANPQEEQTLLIAERDSGVATGAYRLVYAERASAHEDKVTTPEVVGAARIAGRLSLIIARDDESGVSYSVLERTGEKQWRVRWTSRPATCS